MLPTFVIGLREGLEAALIVGIIAAFLRKQGRRDLVRWVFAGVGAAVLLCLAVGVALEVLSRNLPQRQQEGLETVIGGLAVGMVTYMVIWMRRHSRELKGSLEGLAAGALAETSRGARAMVAMAFLAVLREGFETVVFLLAAFNESGSGPAAAIGALLGVLVAIALGYGIYRGGVRLNLARFFRATGIVLILVAAGLVVTALHTAHEAGWLNAGQGRTLDLSWLVRPGSVQSSLLTGMLGIQPHPTVVELAGWLLYLVPVALFVLWPAGRRLPERASARVLVGVGLLAAVAAGVLLAVAPQRPGAVGATTGGGVRVQLTHRDGAAAEVRFAVPGASGTLPVRRVASGAHAGLGADTYTATARDVVGAGAAADTGLAPTLDAAHIATLNGGRLPIGLMLGAGQSSPATYRSSTAVTVRVEQRTGRVLDAHWQRHISASVTGADGTVFALAGAVRSDSVALPPATVARAAELARADRDRLDTRAGLLAAARASAVLALALLAGRLALARAARRPTTAAPAPVAVPH
jgi:high-affinity iron transporter